MLMKLERDRIKAKNEAIEAQMKAMQVSPTISHILMHDFPHNMSRRVPKLEHEGGRHRRTSWS